MRSIVCGNTGEVRFAQETLNVCLAQAPKPGRRAVTVEITVENHPLDSIAAKFDQAFGARPLRGEQQNPGVDFPEPLREARRIERAGDQQDGIRLPG